MRALWTSISYTAETTLDEEFENRDSIPPVRFRGLMTSRSNMPDVSEAGAGIARRGLGERSRPGDRAVGRPAQDRASAVLDIGIRVIEIRQISVVTDCELVTPQERDPAVITFYVVQSGDSLWSIARRYRITVDSLAKANQVEDREGLNPGSKLLIPAI